MRYPMTDCIKSSGGVWDGSPLEAALWQPAADLAGANGAWLIIEGCSSAEKYNTSVGVEPQCASALDRRTNCQPMVGRASREAPLVLSLRLFLPESSLLCSSRR